MGADTVVAAVDADAERRARFVVSPRALRLAVAGVLTVAVVVRFVAVTPMWLDEAQTVEIARRSWSGLFAALRHDGSPPLFYLLLHGWFKLVGTGTFAVRSLSAVFSVACLPLIWLVVRRFGGTSRTAWIATLLLATCPFAVRYATEARMYSFVAMLVLLAMLAWHQVWSRGGIVASAGGVVVTALLVLTHYWCLFAVAVVGAAALVCAVRGSRPARRLLAVIVVGCLAFVPWLPTFAYQTTHTGAPWGGPPGPASVPWAPFGWAGGGLPGVALGFVYYALLVCAVAGSAGVAGGVLIGRPIRRTPTLFAGAAFATLLLGVVVNGIAGSAFANRYTIVALAPFLVAIAHGFEALPQPRRLPALGIVVALGLAVAVTYPAHLRSQSGQAAAALRQARPADVVVFCPDQLGPAVHRLAPHAGRQVVYPTAGSPAMVDWVDYKARNEAADPSAFVRRVLQQAGPQGRVWLVYASGYPTFGDDCARLFFLLSDARGAPVIAVNLHRSVFEHERVALFPAR